MRNQVVVFPFNRVAFLHFDRRRIKLNISHGNLSDGGRNDRRNRFGWNVGVASVTGTSRAAKQRTAEDDGDSAKAGKPESRCSVTCTRHLFLWLT